MKERTFAMDLTPQGRQSCVLMDGEDISGLLRGVTVNSHVQSATTVELHPAPGCYAQLSVRLPEAQVVMAADCREKIHQAVVALSPWTQHHATCARVTDAAVCNCGLADALARYVRR